MRKICFSVALLVLMVSVVNAEILYVNVRDGCDDNAGTKEKPLKTIKQAALLINRKDGEDRDTIKIAPGIYALDETVVFNGMQKYSYNSRLKIEAEISPDDPNWQPQLMPIILSVENPKKKNGKITETYSIKIKTNHVTVQGLKFFGNPSLNNMQCCIERVGEKFDDLIISQCMFIGSNDGLDIYCPVIGNGDRIIVEHCVFYKCHASAVFWDGLDGIGGRGCAMRNCIVRDGFISGIWTCQTDEDFEFKNNIVSGCDYFWIRKAGDTQKYTIENRLLL